MRSPWYSRVSALIETISELQVRRLSDNRRRRASTRLDLQLLERRENPGETLSYVTSWLAAAPHMPPTDRQVRAATESMRPGNADDAVTLAAPPTTSMFFGLSQDGELQSEPAGRRAPHAFEPDPSSGTRTAALPFGDDASDPAPPSGIPQAGTADVLPSSPQGGAGGGGSGGSLVTFVYAATSNSVPAAPVPITGGSPDHGVQASSNATVGGMTDASVRASRNTRIPPAPTTDPARGVRPLEVFHPAPGAPGLPPGTQPSSLGDLPLIHPTTASGTVTLSPTEQWVERGGTANFTITWETEAPWWPYTYWILTINYGDNTYQSWEVGASGSIGTSHTGYDNAMDYLARAWINVRHQGDPGFTEIDSNYATVHTLGAPSTPMPTPTTGGPSGGGNVPCDCNDPIADQAASVPDESSEAPIRYKDGVINYRMVDLESSGFGSTWTQTRSWTNDSTYSGDSINGFGTVDSRMPHLVDVGGGPVGVVSNGITTRYFDLSGGVYTQRFFGKSTLTYDGTAGEFTLTDMSGTKFRFDDFATGVPANQRGRILSETDAYGNVITVTRNTDGTVSDVQRSDTTGGTTINESFLYAYLTGTDPNAGRLSSVTLRRQVNGGTWTTVRKADYAYYDGVESYGNLGDLKTVIIRDAGGNALDTSYYRYYVASEANGYTHGLKYAVHPKSFGRLENDYTNPYTVTDPQLAAYADYHFKYDSQQRVTEEVVQGEGCSLCSAGLGTYTFSYTTSSNTDSVNKWKVKTTETLPDGHQNIVYTNAYGEVMLKVLKDVTTGQQWSTFFQYDLQGRTVLKAEHSAVSGYNDTYADLMHWTGSSYEFLRDTQGLITLYGYASTTTATSTAPGNVAGLLQYTALVRGETTTPALQEVYRYIQRTAGGVTVTPVAMDTVFRNPTTTGPGRQPQTTYLSYTWFSGTTEVESQTVTGHMATAAQNGPISAPIATTYFDRYSRPVWSRDPDGFLSYAAYDVATGAATKHIADVNTSQTSDFTGLPTGWSTPSGGGLHLIAQNEVDTLGRVTKLTDPKGNVTYTVFNDTNYEIRVYDGWDSGANLPTGPTSLAREDRARGYVEVLTMSATPAVTSGRPTGTESVSSLQTLSRDYTNLAGQTVRRDDYFNLSGLTYATTTYIGTAGTHFYTTQFAFDSRGRPNRTITPTATIYRSVYDTPSRVASVWVGTDDTPTTGFWSPTNTAGTDLAKVAEFEYDGGGIGDGNLTKQTLNPGGTAAVRVTQNYFDWRDRLVASKDGVETSEATSLNRPIWYYDYDNLNEVTAVEQYDGDGVSVSDSNSDGVPDRPSSSLLRGKSTAEYDELGRVFRTRTYSVDPSTGAVSANSLATSFWFDLRDNLVKSAAPGGLVTKTQYDGRGHAVKAFVGDGGGDRATGTTGTWNDALNVTGDTVLEQAETQYDANGNVILTKARQRFHDATATGELGDPSSTTQAKARVSYAGYYYDLGDRVTASVNVGTNAGSAWTRPSSAPSRSDTVLVTEFGYNAAGWRETVTDPRNIASKTFYDALARTTKTVEAYSDGVVTATTNRTNEFTYDGSEHLLTYTARVVGGGGQTTQYVYGVSPSDGSTVTSNDLLREVHHPDNSTGSPNSTEFDFYGYNALGDRINFTDRNVSIHSYTFDVLGRPIADAVTTLGTGVDGTVRRMEIAYDGQGNAYLFTSYDAASSGNVVNQVQRAFNGLGQLTTEYQEHSGSVNTGTSPKVQYGYSFVGTSGGANHSRLTSMTYPDLRVLNFNYSSGLDANISRLSSLSDTSATLEAYTYLGLGTVVKRAHAQPGVDLTYIKQSGESNGDAGDQYTGLDRFGRIADQRWIKTSTGTATDRFKYGYDRNGNPLYRDNLVNAAFGELYHADGSTNGYDQLNQLSAFARGTLNGSKDGISGTASRTQSWTLDALGNFSSVTTDGTGQSRTHNQQNEVTAVGSNTLTFDANGNMTTDELGRQLVYDAWSRLAQVKDSGGSTLETLRSDALSRRVSESTSGTVKDLYYSSIWQVLEERVSGQAVVQNVWSPVYVDALVERDRDADGNAANGREERLYVQQDANFGISALLNTSGTIIERYVYDPFGAQAALDSSWNVRTGGSAFGWVYGHQELRYDGVDGLHHARLRDYSPTLGRWTRQDPLSFGAGDSNLYRFLGNGPVTGLDPFGLAPPQPGTEEWLDQWSRKVRGGTADIGNYWEDNFQHAGMDVVAAMAGMAVQLGEDAIKQLTARLGGELIPKFIGFLKTKGIKYITDKTGNKIVRIVNQNGKDLTAKELAALENEFKTCHAPKHHIMTNKNWVSTLRGGPWSPRFEKILKKAGMTFNDVANLVRIPGHQGPHPEAYHEEIFRRIERATDGLDKKAYKDALLKVLRTIAEEATTVGTKLNKLLTGQ